jgi:ABC-2 type transport system ATP-binding protein
MTAPVIRTRALTKRFGRIVAVDGVDLEVAPGDTYGFLGPNGSGKTTVVRMLLGLVFATAGEIDLLGVPVPARVREVLPDVGALVEGPAAYGHLSGRRNLVLLDAAGRGGSRSSRAGRVDDALARVGLGGVDDRPVKAYSLGMRQRLGLAAALLVPRRLLVLDEPTNGLDPGGIQEVRALLAELHAGGTTVFMSSHLLAEIEATCDRVGILDRGRLLVQDHLEVLRAPTGQVLVDTPDADRALTLLDGRVTTRTGERLAVRADDPAALTAYLVGHGLRITGVAVERRSLEDVVLGLVGTGSDRVDRGAGHR